MEIEADFRRDLIQFCRDDMTRNGFTFKDEQDPNRQHMVVMQYCNVVNRVIPPMRRRIEKAKTFGCPTSLQLGLVTFFGKVRIGGDLMAHASTGVMKANRGDQMLSDWGVHHFHLGLGRHKKYPRFVTRTEGVLFAFVTNESVHCIAIMSHEDPDGLSNFAEQQLLETVHTNWPELLSHADMKMPGVPMSKKHLVALRSKNANSLTVMPDGTSYVSVGGGTNSAGTSVRAVYRAARMLHLAREAEHHLRESMDDVQANALEKGRPLPGRPVFRLMFHDGHVCALEETTKVLVRLLPLDGAS